MPRIRARIARTVAGVGAAAALAVPMAAGRQEAATTTVRLHAVTATGESLQGPATVFGSSVTLRPTNVNASNQKWQKSRRGLGLCDLQAGQQRSARTRELCLAGSPSSPRLFAALCSPGSFTQQWTRGFVNDGRILNRSAFTTLTRNPSGAVELRFLGGGPGRTELARARRLTRTPWRRVRLVRRQGSVHQGATGPPRRARARRSRAGRRWPPACVAVIVTCWPTAAAIAVVSSASPLASVVHLDRLDVRLRLAAPGGVAGVADEELQAVGRILLGLELPLDLVVVDLVDLRAVLERVRAGVVVTGAVVRGRPVGAEVDAQPAVVIERVAHDRVADAALDGDAVVAVVGDDVREVLPGRRRRRGCRRRRRSRRRCRRCRGRARSRRCRSSSPAPCCRGSRT